MKCVARVGIITAWINFGEEVFLLDITEISNKDLDFEFDKMLLTGKNALIDQFETRPILVKANFPNDSHIIGCLSDRVYRSIMLQTMTPCVARGENGTDYQVVCSEGKYRYLREGDVFPRFVVI